jgi:tetratricopeptide (TPR) repeat protein
MKTLLTLLCLVILCSSSAYGQDEEIYDAVRDSLFNLQQYEEAVEYLTNELKKYPNNENLLRQLGISYIAAEDYQNGEKYYLEALKINPECSNCYMYISRIYAIKNDFTKALSLMDSSIKYDPDDADRYLMLASIKEKAGEKFGVIYDYKKALELEPDNALIYINKGLFNQRIGYESVAIADLNKAVELQPENYNCYYMRSRLHYGGRRYVESLIDVNKAIELNDSLGSLYSARGAVHSVLGNLKESLADYNRAVEMDPDDFFPYLGRAQTNYAMEDIEASCEDYKIIKKLADEGKVPDPSIIQEVETALQNHCDAARPSFYYQQGVAYYNLGEYKKAVDSYAEGLNKFPNHFILLSFKGNAHLALNQFTMALEYYDRALQQRENLKNQLEENMNFAEATEQEKQMYVSGSLAEIYGAKSDCNYSLGKSETALSDINLAISIASGIPGFETGKYFYKRALINLAIGDLKLAESDINSVIKENPENAISYVVLANIKAAKSDQSIYSQTQIGFGKNNNFVLPFWKHEVEERIIDKKQLESALGNCDKAISLNKDLGVAYYMRGQIKQMLEIQDYCDDYARARRLGVEIEEMHEKACQ